MLKSQEIYDVLIPVEKVFCRVALDMKWKEKIAILTIIIKVEDRIEILNTAGFNQLQMNICALLILHFNLEIPSPLGRGVHFPSTAVAFWC
jgi:hypothetical protein